MKRIAYICVILLCSISFAFAQGAKSGRTNTNSKKVVKKTVVSPFAEAEKAWIPFFTRFSQAVKNRDYESLKTMMIKGIDCWIGNAYGDTDLRDACISDWKKSSETNESKVEWKDWLKLLSTKPEKLRKDLEEIHRFIDIDKNGCGGKGARFIYIKGSWYLHAFKDWECTL